MKRILSSVSIAALLIPVAVSAATAEELTAQIQALLQQVQALNQQVGGSTATTVTGSGTVTPSSVQCPHVSRVLKRGATGPDVTRLQQFLALDPAVYPEAQVTGYYGALTEAAVKRFQCKNKLVCDGTPESTGYGVTGPRTAALLALQCPDLLGGSNAGGFIRVTPVIGNAPLNVAVEATVNTAKSCTATTYELIYGDSSPSATVVVPSNACNEMRQVFNHTYTAPGTYTIILRSGIHQTSATVTVGGSGGGGGGGGGGTGSTQGGGSFAVSPGYGGDAFTVLAQFGLSSNCTAYDLNWGDGSSNATQSQGTCAAGAVTKQLPHTYSTGGTYTITLIRGSGSGRTTDTASATVVY